jgi:hypothetical protein
MSRRFPGDSAIAGMGERFPVSKVFNPTYLLLMKTSSLAILAVSSGALLLTGCASRGDGRIVNPRQPGPALGTAVGAATGAVAGNVAGAVVGVGQGFTAQAGKSFDNDRRVVRTWRTETTSDGRTIQVPVEVEVDAAGRPIGEPRAGSR